MWFFCYFNFERNYDILKSKSPCSLLNKNKNKMESKMENPPPSFREKNLVLQFIAKNRKLKVKLWWVGACPQKGYFLYRLFCPKRTFLRFVFYLNTGVDLEILKRRGALCRPPWFLGFRWSKKAKTTLETKAFGETFLSLFSNFLHFYV